MWRQKHLIRGRHSQRKHASGTLHLESLQKIDGSLNNLRFKHSQVRHLAHIKSTMPEVGAPSPIQGGHITDTATAVHSGVEKKGETELGAPSYHSHLKEKHETKGDRKRALAELGALMEGHTGSSKKHAH